MGLNSQSKRALAANLAGLLAGRADKSRMEHAKLMGVGDGTLGRILYGTGNPGLEVLDSIASYFKLQPWQLIQPADDSHRAADAGSHPMSPEALMVATDLVDETLRGLWLPKHKRFELIVLALEGITQGLPYAQILEFVSPTARKLAMAETKDDSESGLGSTSEAGAGRRKAAG